MSLGHISTTRERENLQSGPLDADASCGSDEPLPLPIGAGTVEGGVIYREEMVVRVLWADDWSAEGSGC